MGIEVKNLYKRFPLSAEDILQDISFSVSDGEFICVLGPSGCGKSTLLNILAGLTEPTSGGAFLDGAKITKPAPERTVMFQESALFPWLNVEENIMFGMKINNYDKEIRKERADKYLAMTGLSDYRKYHIHEISGGMKQRAALARALCMDSKVLLMDEPFASLDKQTINILREELENIWEITKKTIIYITHSVEEAMFFADRIIMMSAHPGRIKKIIPLNFARPRQIDNIEFVRLRAEILHELRSEMSIKGDADI